MSISLRPARAEDLDAVLALERSWATTPGWSRELFRAELAQPRARFLVADCAGRLAGFAVAWLAPPELEIADLAAHPASTRRGVGRALLRALLASGREAGCTEAFLEVSVGNSAARGLYLSEGFAERGRRKGYCRDGSDALVLGLRLG